MFDFTDIFNEMTAMSNMVSESFRDTLRKEAKKNPNVKVNERKTPNGYIFEATINREEPKRTGCPKATFNKPRMSINEYLDALMNENTTKDKKDIRSFFGTKLAIERVIVNGPATVVFWNDGTKTTAKCAEGDSFSKEAGVAICIAKKMLGSKAFYNAVDSTEYTVPKGF